MIRSGDPYRSAREDRDLVVQRLLDRMPDRVDAVLHGNREALIGLLQVAADVAWQARGEVLGTVAEVATDAHDFADRIADCYSEGRPPSAEQCDQGFALADRVDALAVEVLYRRQGIRNSDQAMLPHSRSSTAREARHLARAHAAALRAAAASQRVVAGPDVLAAEQLYASIVTLGRQQVAEGTAAALRSTPDPAGS